MGDVRLLDFDPLTRKRTRFVFNEATDEFTIIEDIVPLGDDENTLVVNQELRKLTDAKTPWKGDLHLVAQIPPTVANDLFRKGILQDEERLRKWLNEADNDVFRTRKGRV